METTEFIKTLHYGTLRLMAQDMADQIDDHDGFFAEDRTPDPGDIATHAGLVMAFGQVISIYCGEGGIPIYGLHSDQFVRLVNKYLPEIKEGLRKKW